MSPGNLSRLENGEHGPPADEVIVKLASILDVDVAELYKLAGRDVGGASFEAQVLSELQSLRREMRAGFKQLDEAVRELRKQQPDA
jgi:transcriptional regulator with XRE-family HTH domain